jgi:FtsP/CotA-like multicopper oxidase with cupredoxin domain
MGAAMSARHVVRPLAVRTLIAALAAAGLAACNSDSITGPAPMTRTYYIAADEVAWDFAPSGTNQITGAAFDADALVFVGNDTNRIGHVYKKALYREYTDATFSALKPRPAAWAHLGSLGPLIRAQVGDTIRVVFRNNTGIDVSMHPHGVEYAKDSEGAPYNDGTGPSDQGDDAVPPGGTYTYLWTVPERAGPGPNDGSSVMWMYHSHVVEQQDVNTGLVGPIIVTARGRTREDGTPDDVDREFVVNFEVINENASFFLDDNIQTYAGIPASVDPADDEFYESNLMHSINGYVFGNQPMMTMQQGERVRWYVMAMGTEVDLHTPHWHGQTVLEQGMRTDVIELLPATMVVVDMLPDNPGIWLFHCHVDDHIAAGMLTRFTVQ